MGFFARLLASLKGRVAEPWEATRCFLRLTLRSGHIKIDRPIFLLGLQGGGLTLLSRILRRHQAATSVSGRWEGRDEMQNYLADSLPDSLRLQASPPYGESDFGDGSWVYATDDYLHLFRKTSDDADPGTAKRFQQILRERIARYGTDVEATRLVDKSQTFTLKVGFIEELLSGAAPHFVLIVRNPYLMCKKSIRKPALSELDLSDEERLRLTAQHYDNSMQAALEDAEDVERFYLLRFEDFLMNPYVEVEGLCNFLGLEFQAQMLPSENDPRAGKWYPIRYTANEGELEELTTAEKKIIDSRCREWVKRFGYDDEPSNRGRTSGGPIESWGL